jgi:site-specific DNA-methyltransferase (adenine-specific)
MNLDTVVCCDALAFLRGLDDDCADLTLTDLPYGTTANRWDAMPDLDELWSEFRRIRKPSAATISTASQPFSTDLINSNRREFRYEWIWVKSLPTGHLNAKRNPLKLHELVLVFYKKLGVYSPQMASGKPYRATRGAAGGYVRDKSTANHTTINKGERFPTSVLYFNSPPNPVHPTQKPVALFSYLIRTYTRPGDLVVDPFVGSGTTALAARNTGRRFICGDFTQEYVDIANARLAEPFTPNMFDTPPTPDDPAPVQQGLGLD